MASDLAIVFGRTGLSTSLSLLIMVTMGPQPSACAACIFVLTGPSIRPSVFSSLMAFQILVIREPPAQGTTTCCGVRQPSCSTISYAVFCLKKKKERLILPYFSINKRVAELGLAIVDRLSVEPTP